MPVLWGDTGTALDVDLTFVGPRLTSRAFRSAFDREAARMEAMLGI